MCLKVHVAADGAFAMSEYRASALRCPSCSALLEEVGAGDALIDICRQCRGIYLDWFDGEPRELVQHVVTPLGVLGLGAEPKALPGPCPRCAVPLHVELFENRGPWIHRCQGCQGVYLDFASAELLATTASPDPPKDEAAGPLSRLATAVRAFFT